MLFLNKSVASKGFEMYKLVCRTPALSQATLHFSDYLVFFQVPNPPTVCHSLDNFT